MFLRRLLQGSIASLIALVGLVWVVQTPTGFQRVIIPVLAVSDLGSLQAAHGELDLRGELNLTDARYQYADAGIDVSLQSGSLALDLFSLFGSDPIAIRSLELEGTTVTLRNSTEEDDTTAIAIPVVPSVEAIAEESSLALPFTLHSGRLKNFTYRQIEEDGESVIQAESLLLENLGPNQTATLQGKLRWQNPATGDTLTTVQVEVEAEMGLNAQSAPHRWKLKANANQTTPQGTSGEVTGTLSLAVEGNHPNDDQLKAQIRLEGQRAGATFGNLEGNISLAGLRGPSLIQSLGVEIETQIHQLSLGPLLSFLPPDPSRPEVRGEVNGSAGPLQINTDLVVVGLRVEGSPVPTRELKIGLQTTSNLEQSGDFLEIAELKIVLGEGHLRAHGEATPTKASFAIHIEANEFPVASLLALGGLDTAAEFGALPLNGKVDIERDDAGTIRLTNDSSLAVLLPGTKKPEVFQLKSHVSSPTKGPIKAEINASQPKENGSISIQASVDKTTDVAVRIADMNLTALVQPFLEAKTVHAQEQAPAENIPLPETAAKSEPGEPSAQASPLKFRLKVDRSRYRAVEIGAMAVDADISGTETHIKVDATEFSKGSLSFKLDMANAGPVRIEWQGEGEGIRLQPLMDAFAGSTTVGGRLKFNTTGRSTEPAPAINGLDGSVALHLRDGKLQGFEALDMLATATGINLLGAFAFSKLDGDIQIESGIARVKQLQAGGAVGNIQVQGTIDLKDQGSIDLRLNPRVGPSVAGLAKGFKPLNSVLNTAEGLLSLPVNIVITGSFAAPQYAVHSQSATEAVSSRGGKLIGEMLNELTLGGSSKLMGALLPSPSGKDAAEPPTATEKP
jgi:hypothetical protein